MQGIHIKAEKIPSIGFAHHFCAENYYQSYGEKDDTSFEIVYTKEGTVTAELYEKTYQIPPHSIFLLVRALPIRLYSEGGIPHSHCTVQIQFGSHSVPLFNGSTFSENETDGINLPFIIPPSHETQAISKELFSVAAAMNAGTEEEKFSARLCAMGILAKLNRIYLQNLYSKNNASLTEHKLKRYIIENIDKDLSLTSLAAAMGKSPNYLNNLFKSANGISIRQYINNEKVRIIGELMKTKGISFRDACLNVSVDDTSYGYRLFKKHTGLTPKEFLLGDSPANKN